MKKKGMKNLFLILTIIMMLVLQSSLVSAQSQISSYKPGLFGLQFVITVFWYANDTQTPIHPRELRTVLLTIAYTETHGVFGRTLLLLLKGRPFPFRLSIVDKPDWCIAQLSTENFIGLINPDEAQIADSELSIQLSENAPLNHTLGYVKIHVAINDMKGPFNILTLIQGFEGNFTVCFVTSP
jgi:hypothetical protein